MSDGLHAESVEHVDLTHPDADGDSEDCPADLAIIGAPVYAGRLPATMIARFRRVRGNGTPAAVVVVYGNRAYEDALLELRDLVRDAGFTPVAAGAFVGEHSYSTAAFPIAAGRPDAIDRDTARSFGETIRHRHPGIAAGGETQELAVPGNFPYKELRMLTDVAPATEQTLCLRCFQCVPSCPTGAISADDPGVTDKSLCIRCCACVKICHGKAKSLNDPRITQIAEHLSTTCGGRKEPETWLISF